MIARPCHRCGDPIPTGSYCPDCHPGDTKISSRTRGYDTAWTKLSRRARKLQPFCSDCGATNDLQADHSPQAWERHAQGRPIRLQDIDVVCGPCNRTRGTAKPLTRGYTQNQNGPAPEGKAQKALHLTMIPIKGGGEPV